MTHGVVEASGRGGAEEVFLEERERRGGRRIVIELAEGISPCC